VYDVHANQLGSRLKKVILTGERGMSAEVPIIAKPLHVAEFVIGQEFERRMCSRQ